MHITNIRCFEPCNLDFDLNYKGREIRVKLSKQDADNVDIIFIGTTKKIYVFENRGKDKDKKFWFELIKQSSIYYQWITKKEDSLL